MCKCVIIVTTCGEGKKITLFLALAIDNLIVDKVGDRLGSKFINNANLSSFVVGHLG